MNSFTQRQTQSTLLSSDHTQLFLVMSDDLPYPSIEDQHLLLKGATHVDVAFLEEHLSEYSGVCCVIVLTYEMNVALFMQIDTVCERMNVPWVSFHVEQSTGWLGPMIIPGQTANYHDLIVRRLSAFDDPAVFQALITSSHTGNGQWLLTSVELRWMLSIFFAEIERWMQTSSCQLVGVEVEANPLSLSLIRHPILPLPERTFEKEIVGTSPGDMNLLVSERCGIVLRTVEIEHHPSIPAAVTTVQAHAAHMWWHYPTWHNDSTGVGSAFHDTTQVSVAAIAEAAERYAANCLPLAKPERATYAELCARDTYAVNPASLALFDTDMYAEEGCPFAPFTHDTPVYWVEGWSVSKSCSVWVPLSMVYVNWQMGHFDQPVVHDTFYPGIAAGATLEQAIVAGLEELIERDTMMIWWLNRPVVPALQLPTELSALWEGVPAQYGQHAWLIPLPNQFDIPVMAGVVANTQENLLNIGFACRPDPIQAGMKAWTEAITLQEGSRDINDPEGRVWAEVEAGTLADVFKPWRADRRYLDSYRADFRDITEQNAQQQLFLDSRAIEYVQPWVNVSVGQSIDQLPRLPDRTLATYQSRLEASNFEIIYVDLTTPDIAQSGLRVVRVLVPGLVPDFPAAFPHLGGGRIQQIPVALGWCDSPTQRDELNYFPMPHA